MEKEFLTLKELEEFLDSPDCERYASTEEFVDENGNCEGERIFKYEGKYYSIFVCNDNFCPYVDRNWKWMKNELGEELYRLTEVTKKKKKIKVIEWIPVEG